MNKIAKKTKEIFEKYYQGEQSTDIAIFVSHYWQDYKKWSQIRHKSK